MMGCRVRAVARTLVTGALAVLLAACAGAGRQTAPPERVSGVVDTFMARVVAADNEGAFGLIDIEALVNFGHPQGEVYRSLPPADRERYRRDFVEGVYAFLFRDQPRAAAAYSVAVPDRRVPVAEVVGRPGKRLLMTVRKTSAGMRIVRIEKP